MFHVKHFITEFSIIKIMFHVKHFDTRYCKQNRETSLTI